MKTIGQRERFGSHLGLERIQLICEALGNPQEHLKFIHVAGTNGKGSVSAFLAEVLEINGLKVGLFTSPHLEDYQERFQINRTPIDLSTLEKHVERAEEGIGRVEKAHPELGPVTEFELATIVSFLYFRQSQVDAVILETGLGGRLDATNVVNPQLTVITSVGLDHMDRLGTSLKEIAREKGGIIKSGVPVISGVQEETSELVLREIASNKRAPWRSIQEVSWTKQGWNLTGGKLIFPGLGLIEIGLLGDHQLQNAATALLALEELISLGWSISVEAIREGMKKTRWPGRLEIVSQDPFILLDGSHNQQGIAALVQNLQYLEAELGRGKFTFVFGMLQNKSLDLIDPLIPLGKRFIFTAADSGRLAPMDPDVLTNYVQGQGVSAVGYPTIALAMADALETPPLCVCGSLYLVGTIKRFLRS